MTCTKCSRLCGSIVFGLSPWQKIRKSLRRLSTMSSGKVVPEPNEPGPTVPRDFQTIATVRGTSPAKNPTGHALTGGARVAARVQDGSDDKHTILTAREWLL